MISPRTSLGGWLGAEGAVVGTVLRCYADPIRGAIDKPVARGDRPCRAKLGGRILEPGGSNSSGPGAKTLIHSRTLSIFTVTSAALRLCRARNIPHTLVPGAGLWR